MAGSRYALLLASGLLLIWPNAAPGNWFRPAPRVAWYYPPVVSWVPAYPVYYYNPYPVYYFAAPPLPCPPLIIPTPASPPLAIPTPAPPSAGPVRVSSNTGNPGAQVAELRPFFEAYAIAPRPSEKPAADQCTVAFWNLSGRDVSVRVGERTHLLAKGKNVRLDMPRKFVWRVGQREPQSETVPSTSPGLEIVIRR